MRFGPNPPYIGYDPKGCTVYADGDVLVEFSDKIYLGELAEEVADEAVNYCLKLIGRKRRDLRLELEELNLEIRALKDRRNLLWSQIEKLPADRDDPWN